MKQSIDWHEGCLLNSKMYLQRLKAEAAALESRISRLAATIDLEEKQLKRAKRLGKTSYDSERFKPDA